MFAIPSTFPLSPATLAGNSQIPLNVWLQPWGSNEATSPAPDISHLACQETLLFSSGISLLPSPTLLLMLWLVAGASSCFLLQFLLLLLPLPPASSLYFSLLLLLLLPLTTPISSHYSCFFLLLPFPLTTHASSLLFMLFPTTRASSYYYCFLLLLLPPILVSSYYYCFLKLLLLPTITTASSCHSCLRWPRMWLLVEYILYLPKLTY